MRVGICGTAFIVSVLIAAGCFAGESDDSVVPPGLKPAAKQPKIGYAAASAAPAATAATAATIPVRAFYGDAHGVFVLQGGLGVLLGRDLNNPPRYVKATLTRSVFQSDPDYELWQWDGKTNLFGIARVADPTTLEYHIIISDGRPVPPGPVFVDWDDAKNWPAPP